MKLTLTRSHRATERWSRDSRAGSPARAAASLPLGPRGLVSALQDALCLRRNPMSGEEESGLFSRNEPFSSPTTPLKIVVFLLEGARGVEFE